MTVEFNQIPQNFRLPGFFVEVDDSKASSFVNPGRLVVFGQMLTGGTAVVGVPIPIASVDAAIAAFGAGSILAGMIAAIRGADPFGLLFAVPLADAAGATAASGTITVTAAPSVVGSIPLYIGGVSVPVAVAGTETVNTTAAAIAAAINAVPNLPVTAAAEAAVVTLTARNKGTLGNDIQIQYALLGAAGGESLPAGFTSTLSGASLAGGATDPTVAAAFTALGDEAYDYILMPYADTGNLNAAQAAMNQQGGRWSYNRQCWGHVFTAMRSSVSAALTFGLARNDPHTTILPFYKSPTPLWQVLGAYAAAAAVVLRNDPARPVQTIEIPGMIAPPQGDGRFTQTERNTLLWSGMSSYVVGEDGICRIERLISTYQENANGQPSDAWLSVEKSYTLMTVFRRLQAVWTANFPRHKLAPDGTRFSPGAAIVTPSLAKGFIVVEMRNMEFLGLLMNVTASIPLLTCEINVDNPDRLDVLFPPTVIGQLRLTAVLGQFRTNSN